MRSLYYKDLIAFHGICTVQTCALSYVVVVVVMFGRVRGRIRWFKKVSVVILCYIANIKLQIDSMGRDYVLEGRDQDQKLRNNLLYSTIYGLGCV